MGVCYQWEGRGYKEKVSEDEYGRNIMYTCMKMQNWALLREGRFKRMMEGMKFNYDIFDTL
jgi:hypothetical protein